LSGLLLTRLRVWVPHVSRLPGCVIATLSMVCIWCRFSVTARSRHTWKRSRAGLDWAAAIRTAAVTLPSWPLSSPVAERCDALLREAL
jgi:hypothetical protein